MKPIKTFLIQSIFGIALLTVISCSSKENTGNNQISNISPVSVTVATPSEGNTQGINASGQVEALQTANISTRVMGFISKITVKVGDKVTKGQLLVSISNQDIQAKRAQADAMLTEAEASLKNAQKDFDRYTNLFNQHSASAKELDNVTLQYHSAQARVEAAKQMRNEAGAMLSYTSLTAPFSGVVTQKMADAGSMASPGMPILTIEQGGNYQVSVAISETDINQIKLGANATVTIKSAGKFFKGNVTQIDPSSQSSGGQYLIKLSVPDQEKDGLYSGMYVNVFIPHKKITTIDNVNNTVLVPTSALINKDQLTGIYTISNSRTALLRWVRLGKIYGNEVEVISGLGSEEKFIASAEGKLYNGVPVAIKK